MNLIKPLSPAWAGALALTPYAVMKTYWAFGGAAGRPEGDLAAEFERNGAPEPLIWMERHGLDFTVLGAVGGLLLLLALVRPWGMRIPRWALLVPGWAGAVFLVPYGIGTVIAATLGMSVGSTEGWSPWVGVVGGVAFAGFGGALAVSSRSYQRRSQTGLAHRLRLRHRRSDSLPSWGAPNWMS
ncbi:hypothetical protein GCM10010169_49700 [Micromonospora fulviviridis]|uniref:DUF3995 domain-containing protein n=1 Tax=Micromonospora fulviviridis TaxID=47860 RepID=UPI0016644C8F|nr:DUF3995 domain-containing protein [Micromonospora fulviviridis]GGR99144.1 hypothetical protein GCM10010169_49700 [Micromonospora fulviviridis]